MQVAVEDDDPLEALGDEAVDDGARAAAGAEDHRVARHLLRPTSLSSATLKPADVGVVADELLAFLGDRIDRARRVGLLGQPIHQRDDPLLVRDRDVRAQELVGPQLGDRVRELDRTPVPQLVAGVDPELVEGGLLHRARERVGDGMADQDDPPGHARTRSRSAKNPG